jgi:hypothetical protein
VVVLQGSTVSWSRSLGFSVHSSWNIAHLNDLQFAQAYERAELDANMTPPQQSIVPIKTLTINVAAYLVSQQQAAATDNATTTSCISASLLARMAAVLQRIATDETTVSEQLTSQGIDSTLEPANAMVEYCEVSGCQCEISLHYYRCEDCDESNGFSSGVSDGRKPVYMCITCGNKHKASQLGCKHTMQALRKRPVTLEQLQQLAVNIQKLADERANGGDSSSGATCAVSAVIAEHPEISFPLFKFDSEYSSSNSTATAHGASLSSSTAAAASSNRPVRRQYIQYDTDATVHGVPTEDALTAQLLNCDDTSMDMLQYIDWGHNSNVNAIATAGDLLDNSSSSIDCRKYIALAQQGIQTANVLGKLAARMTSSHGANNNAANTAIDKNTGETAMSQIVAADDNSSSNNTGNVNAAAQAAVQAANDSYTAFQKLLAALEGKTADE